MRSLLMLVVGTAFTALLLWVPALHLVRWSGGGLAPGLALTLALPLLALVAAAFRPRPALALFAFPVSHLPALVLDEALSGPLVYDGPAGLASLAVVAAAGAAWVTVTLWPAPTPEAPDAAPATLPSPAATPVPAALLPAVALVMAVGIYAAFAASALPAVSDPLAASVTLLVGVVAVWLAVGRLIVGDWGDVLLERDARDRLANVLDHPPRARNSAVWWAVFLALVGALVGAMWYLR